MTYAGGSGFLTPSLPFVRFSRNLSVLLVHKIDNSSTAFVWMSFMDGPDTTFQGVTGEDYDLYFEVWQEFDPQGTQYMEYK